MSGGSDSTSTSGPPEWMTPYLQDYYGTAKQTANLPYQPYEGQRVSDMNPYTVSGLNATAQRALTGSQEVGEARTQLGNTLNGGYMGYQAPQNQQAGVYNQNAGAYNPNANVANSMAGAQNANTNVLNQQAGVQNQSANAYNWNANASNQFSGSNPYLGGMIDASSQDVIRNYNNAVKPQTESAMARSGSFGNSGLQEMQRTQQSDLQKNLGNISNQFRFQDYTTQQGLDEARLGRMYGAGAQTVGNQFSAGENLANRLYGAGQQRAANQFQAGRDVQSQLYGAGQQQAQNIYGAGQSLANQLYGAGQQQAQNIYGAGADLAQRQDSNYNAERARQMQGISLAPSLAAQDYVDANALTSAGDRFGAQNQALLDQQYGNFAEAREFPYKQLATLGSAFGANPGTTTTTNPGSPSPLAQAIGLGSVYGGIK